MNFYFIPPLLCSACAFFLGIFVLTKNTKSRINQVFFLLCLAITTWLSLYAIINFCSHLNIEGKLSLLSRIAYCGVTFIATTVFHYTSELVATPRGKIFNRINYFFAFIICFLIVKTDFIVNGLYHYYWGLYPKAGPYHPFFLIYFFGASTLAVPILVHQILIEPNAERKRQTKYLLSGFIIFTFASFDFLPNYGIETYPFGYLPTTIFLLIIAYAIVKHRLMNIAIVFRKGIIYSFLFSLITIFYLLVVFFIERSFQTFFGYRSIIISLTTTILIALLFTPLRNQIQSFVDKYFFKGTQIQIAEENELLRQELVRVEKLKAVSTLASGIAHEIKNPLTAIRTFTEFLPDKKSDPEFLDKFSKIVGHEVDRIDDLVHQLLDFAKPSPPQPVNTDIHKLIDETLDFLNNNFIKQSIKISKGYARENVYLDIDHNQIKQALLNIILNAIDAMPKGGTLSVKTEKTTEKIRIFIADTGEGISKRDLAHIFDPFFTKKDGGTGLGLAITHEIIKTHNGRITVKSEPGKGAEFKIELPFAGSLG